jgi:predicted MFS family arabinose efflux permease
MVAALALPSLLEGIPDRRVMLAGTVPLIGGLLLGPLLPGYAALLPLWFVIGIGYALVQTPSGRLLRRSARPEDRPAVFAAQFALSHACWLVTYPLAGWLGAGAGMPTTFAVLGVVAAAGALAAASLWPSSDPDVIEHDHPELPDRHPHLAGAVGHRHSHAFVIDADHPVWPRGR